MPSRDQPHLHPGEADKIAIQSRPLAAPGRPGHRGGQSPRGDICLPGGGIPAENIYSLYFLCFVIQMVLLFSDNFGSSSGRRGHFWARSFPYLFLLFYEASLRAPRRRGPSFCIDRKKAKSDQGCALDPDGQRRRSLRFKPTNAAQSAWTGALPNAMIDVNPATQCLVGRLVAGWDRFNCR